MPALRTCDGCGIKMPRGVRRNRTGDGRLLCDGCTDGKRGNPGRPIGHHGSLEEALMRCEACGNEMGPKGLVRTGGLLRCADGCPKTANIQVQAHDLGDSKVIAHCPFCGGGQLTARSDGTANCEFCGNSFTVQVQPQFSAMPQTINGQPVQDPSMPDHADQTPQEAERTGDEFAPAGSAAPPADQFAPAGSAGPAPDQFAPAGTAVASKTAMPWGRYRPRPNDVQAAKIYSTLREDGYTNPPSEEDRAKIAAAYEVEVSALPAEGNLAAFAKALEGLLRKQSYRTATGAVLGEESYLRYLALETAEDRPAMLAYLRGE